jgi:hypothetical protein
LSQRRHECRIIPVILSHGRIESQNP